MCLKTGTPQVMFERLQHETVRDQAMLRFIPDDPEAREPKFKGLDIFTEPGETRRFD